MLFQFQPSFLSVVFIEHKKDWGRERQSLEVGRVYSDFQWEMMHTFTYSTVPV